MQVRERTTYDAGDIAPTNTLQEAAEKMKQLDVGPLPVCENKRLKGILTDRDIVLLRPAEWALSKKFCRCREGYLRPLFRIATTTRKFTRRPN